MQISEIDIFILKEIFGKGVVTTWNMALSYNWPDKPKSMIKSKENAFFSAKTGLIEYRIKRLAKEGFIKIEKNNGEKIFILDEDRIIINKHKLPCGYKECLFLKDSENKWMICQIDN